MAWKLSLVMPCSSADHAILLQSLHAAQQQVDQQQQQQQQLLCAPCCQVFKVDAGIETAGQCMQRQGWVKVVQLVGVNNRAELGVDG
jgi:hypothetical protein